MFAAHLRRLYIPITSPPPPNPPSILIKFKTFTPGVIAGCMRMASSSSKDPASNPKVAELRGLIAEDAKGGWEKCWEGGLTPWDIGQPTPILVHLLETGALPKGRVFIPGCGTGYDVVAIARPDRYVVGLDVSESAIKKAKEWSSTAPSRSYFSFLVADFFSFDPPELFDLVFDYTFFCAINPRMRSAWAKKINDILKPDGELITLIYPIGDQRGGPPYNLNVADYEEVLNPLGLKALSVADNELAIKPRKGREKIGRWKRCLNPSAL